MSDTDPGDNELAADVLNVGLDLAGDVQLMTVERDALQVDLKVTLRCRVRTLVIMKKTVKKTAWLLITSHHKTLKRNKQSTLVNQACPRTFEKTQ